MEIVLIILIAIGVLWLFVTERHHSDLGALRVVGLLAAVVALAASKVTPILVFCGLCCIVRVAACCPTRRRAYAASLLRPRIRGLVP